MSIRIVLADDHIVVRDGLRSLLERQSDMAVVAVAADGLEAVQLTSEHNPDVVLMDVSMPGLNGIEASRRICMQRPEIKLICLSMHAESRFVSAMLESGATGYLLKDCAGEELIRAIHTVMAGQVHISPGIGQVVVDHFKSSGVVAEDSAFSILTDKEREVLQLLAEGHSTKAIGVRLRISTKTVASHREHLMQKLGIPSVAGLTKYAIQEGLTALES